MGRNSIPSDSLVRGELSPSDCFEIGVFALYRGYYYMAVEWLEQAKKTSNSNDSSFKLDKIDIDFTMISQFLNLVLQEVCKQFKIQSYG